MNTFPVPKTGGAVLRGGAPAPPHRPPLAPRQEGLNPNLKTPKHLVQHPLPLDLDPVQLVKPNAKCNSSQQEGVLNSNPEPHTLNPEP